MPIAELEQCDAVLLIGSNLQKEQPFAALRVRKAVSKGAAILAVNPVDYRLILHSQQKILLHHMHYAEALAALVKALHKPTRFARRCGASHGATITWQTKSLYSSRCSSVTSSPKLRRYAILRSKSRH